VSALLGYGYGRGDAEAAQEHERVSPADKTQFSPLRLAVYHQELVKAGHVALPCREMSDARQWVLANYATFSEDAIRETALSQNVKKTDPIYVSYKGCVCVCVYTYIAVCVCVCACGCCCDTCMVFSAPFYPGNSP
jgi:hypothetical protein